MGPDENPGAAATSGSNCGDAPAYAFQVSEEEAEEGAGEAVPSTAEGAVGLRGYP